MRAINHAMTGAVIGLAIGQPALALPLAIASHFVLDSVPHFGIERGEDARATWFLVLLVIDALLCTALVVALYDMQPVHWLLAAVCAFGGAAPDFMLVNVFRRARSKRPLGLTTTTNPLIRVHHLLQTELPQGIMTEMIWAATMLALLISFVV